MKLVESLASESSDDTDLATAMPKLSIGELMVLTASMAIAFAFQESLASGNAGMKADVLWFDTLQRIQFALIYGLPLAAMFRFGIQKRVTGKFLLHPGHWILFGMLVMVLGFMVPYSILRSIAGSTDPSDTFFGDWYFLINGFFSLAASIALLRGARQFSWVWTAVILATAANFAAYAAHMAAYAWMFLNEDFGGSSIWVAECFSWIDTISSALMVFALIPAIWSDFNKKNQRDLWHWLGLLLLFVIGVVSPTLVYIFSRFFAV